MNRRKSVGCVRCGQSADRWHDYPDGPVCLACEPPAMDATADEFNEGFDETEGGFFGFDDGGESGADGDGGE